jgi:uncharacterized protein (DUF1697 family)
MPEYISLLRGINVGGKTLKMDKLRSIYESLNLRDIKTYIQSGNVLFNARIKNVEKIKKEIEIRINKEASLAVTVIIRTPIELKKILSSNPFVNSGIKEIDRMYVTFLENEPTKELLKELKPARETKDEFKVIGKEIFLFCPGGYGRTILSNDFFEKKLRMNATTRNWRTVNKLYDLSKSS